jgi:hypothetical protein
MPNANVRAKATALPEETNRRAVLGAVLASGAAGATAILPAAASSQPQLSAIDLRVLDLWRRRARLQAINDKTDEQITAAEAQMPTWARSGPKYVLAKGELFIPGIDDVNVETVGWPEVADLDQQPINAIGKAWSLDDFENGVSGVTMLTVVADEEKRREYLNRAKMRLRRNSR